MERSRRRGIRVQIQSLANPDLVPLGLPSPQKNAVIPGSVSPRMDYLQALVSKNEGRRKDGDVETGIGRVSLGDLLENGRKRKPKKKKSVKEDGNVEEVLENHVQKEDEVAGELELPEEPAAVRDEHVDLASSSSSSSSNEEDPSSWNSNLEEFEVTLLRILQEQLKDSDFEPASAQNQQEQDDEVLALQAIYEGKFKLLSDERSGSRIFMINVVIEVPESIQIVMPSLASSSTQPAYNFSLEHLPPIYLACAYTSDYPSSKAPPFVLYSKWMNADQLSQLAERLEEIWSDQAGQVVLYAWVDFLHTQSLSTLGDDHTFVLKNSSENEHSSRILSDFTTPDKEVVSLLSHNEDMQRESFRQSFHRCDICYTEYAGKDFLKFPCQHFYCKTCMGQYASVHVTDGSVNRIKCPDQKCQGAFPPHFLKELLSPEAFDRWEKLSLQRTLDAMADVVYCPRCETACIEESDHVAQCGYCYYVFCSLCRQTSHFGRQCMSPEDQLLVLLQRSKSKGLGADHRAELNLVNEILNLKAVRRDSKQCPNCRMAIHKTEGCNKMVCTNCLQTFCFICGQSITGYEHFRGACQLFDAAELAAWEARMNPQNVQENRQMIAPFLGPGPPQPQQKACPTCRQQSARVGNNNHMFCWSCGNHYCALCRKVVRRVTEHYGGPNKCKQHTD